MVEFLKGIRATHTFRATIQVSSSQKGGIAVKRAIFALASLATALALSSCGAMMKPMASMMGMGDKLQAMENMDEVMGKGPAVMKQHMMAKQQIAIVRGKNLFNDPSTGGGKKGISCNSCHPGGGTTGGEAQIPMTNMKMPIPSLRGVAATFPKYKAPNDAVISLQHMNNNCIGMFMGGKGLALESSDSYALSAYVMSLSNGEEIRVGQ